MNNNKKTKTRTLRIGTDCSGIEAPIQALISLGIPFVHVFCSDIDKYCIKSIKANYSPGIIFGDDTSSNPSYANGDITKRKIEDVPDIDLYICGFPCQPFSMAGERKGFDDRRGNVFFTCLEVIVVKQPTYFILENVKGILGNDNGNTWNLISGELKKLEIYGYRVDWKVLNTKDYGIPQNRERIYIVGIKEPAVFNNNTLSKNKTGERESWFEWPEKTEMNNLSHYIDETDETRNNCLTLYKYKTNFDNIPENSKFIMVSILHRNKFMNSDKWSPCITSQTGLWCVPKHRYANIKEYLMLQGFPADFIQAVSDTRMKKQIGNSMSVNVLKVLLCTILNQPIPRQQR